MEKTSKYSIGNRSTWPVSRYHLGGEPSDDLSESTSPEERLAMMWELAEQGWLWAGRDFPEYDRDNIPGKVLRNCR